MCHCCVPSPTERLHHTMAGLSMSNRCIINAYSRRVPLSAPLDYRVVLELVAHRAFVEATSCGYMWPTLGPLKHSKVSYMRRLNDPSRTEHGTELVSHE